MNGVPDRFEDPIDRAEFRRPAHRAGVELYRAHIVRHSFAPHAHEGCGVGVVDRGVERFRHRGGTHRAGPGSLVLMNADELHTGDSETPDGWRYRMLYLDPGLLAELTGSRQASFAEVVAHDPEGAGRVHRLLGALWAALEDPLAFDDHLLALAAPLQRHLAAPTSAEVGGSRRAATDPTLQRAAERLADQSAARHTLDELAAESGLSPFQFLRRFKAAHGVTPHEWLMARRMAEAKRRLARGEAPADVAATVGLADQPHLTRRFAQMYGVTPARYQRQLGLRNA